MSLMLGRAFRACLLVLSFALICGAYNQAQARSSSHLSNVATFHLMAPSPNVGLSDPCRTVHVALYDDRNEPIPSWFSKGVAKSLFVMSTSSHIPLVLDPVIHTRPTRTRQGHGPYAALTLTLTDRPAQFRSAGSAKVGLTTPDTLAYADGTWSGPWNTANTYLSRSYLLGKTSPGTELAPDGTISLVIHELSHALGLNHAPGGIMSEHIPTSQVLDPGTAEGLAFVGCHTHSTTTTD